MARLLLRRQCTGRTTRPRVMFLYLSSHIRADIFSEVSTSAITEEQWRQSWLDTKARW
jgi:hypothetical protein